MSYLSNQKNNALHWTAFAFATCMHMVIHVPSHWFQTHKIDYSINNLYQSSLSFVPSSTPHRIIQRCQRYETLGQNPTCMKLWLHKPEYYKSQSRIPNHCHRPRGVHLLPKNEYGRLEDLHMMNVKCSGMWNAVECEMQWTVNWFRWKKEQWNKRLSDLEDEERPPGLDCYCHKQMALWGSLADQAQTKFSTLLGRPLSW